MHLKILLSLLKTNHPFAKVITESLAGRQKIYFWLPDPDITKVPHYNDQSRFPIFSLSKNCIWVCKKYCEILKFKIAKISLVTFHKKNNCEPWSVLALTLAHYSRSVTLYNTVTNITVTKDLQKTAKINVTLRYLFTAWKVSKYGAFSSPCFPAFGLNRERYSVSLRIQSEWGKIRTRTNSVFGHSSRSVQNKFLCYIKHHKKNTNKFVLSYSILDWFVLLDKFD